MPIVFNFITTLNLKGRLGILDAVAEEFSKELEILKNILRVDITSAIELMMIRKTLLEITLQINCKRMFVSSGMLILIL